jgi:energy-coupling factor transporter ATP-binding protein EcfA2
VVRNPLARKFFAGGNTAYGFYSLFDYIQESKKGKMVVLKGGPGTGKSTLMRNLGKRILEKGGDVEFFYCSSDSTSLDGVASPSFDFAVIDGTPPHAIDLELPGVYDVIINLGEFWDARKLVAYRDELESVNKAIKESFAAAYSYLAEANLTYKKLQLHTESIMDQDKNDKMLLHLLERILDDEPYRHDGKERHLFASAISPEGLVNHYESIFSACKEFYFLTGSLGTGISDYLEHLYRVLRLKGLSLEVFHCALDPEKIDALVIPELRVALVKVTAYQPVKLSSVDILYQENLSFDNFCPHDDWKKDLIEDHQNRFNDSLYKGIDCIKRAKELQMHREPYYSKAMDFSKVERVEEELAAKFLRP